MQETIELYTDIIEELGIYPAFIYTVLLNKIGMTDEPQPFTVIELWAEVGLTAFRQQKQLEKLEEAGYLEVTYGGLYGQRHIKIL